MFQCCKASLENNSLGTSRNELETKGGFVSNEFSHVH